MPSQPSFLRGTARSRKPILSTGGVSLPLTATIPGTEAESGLLGQKHTIYLVQMVAFGLTSHSRHSFEDFEALHAQISAKVPFQLPALPRTYWFGNEDPQTVQERRERLERLLSQLLSQSQVLCDGEELLLRFLHVPKAAVAAVRFVLQSSSQNLLHRLYETTSEPEGFLVLQDRQLESALITVLEAPSGQCSQEAKRLACELLARTFRAGESEGPPVRRCEQVKALIALIVWEEGTQESMPLEVRTSARKALLTLACANRSSWSATLLEFLQDEGAMEQVLAASNREGEEGQRLVVELLLRGFDGPVAQRFAASPPAPRKRLLNQLFMSRDAFVRVAVGLLLAALLCQEDYGEAAQAEAGLAAVREELAAPGLALGDLKRLLEEDDCWHWLCHLAAAQSTAGHFALVTLLVVGAGLSRIAETAGLHELLVQKLSEADPQLRALAARALLDLYRSFSLTPGADDQLLGRAVAASAAEVLEQQEQSLQSLSEGAAEALQRERLVSELEPCLSASAQGARALGLEADAWLQAVARAKEKATRAAEAKASASEALTSFSSKLHDACSRLGAGTLATKAEPRAYGPGDVDEAQAELDRLMEARRSLGRRLHEAEEELQSWTSELELSKSSLAKDASAAIRAAECQKKREVLQQELAAGQQKAQSLDNQMRHTCEALSLCKAEARPGSYQKVERRVLGQGLQAWAAVSDAQLACGLQLEEAWTSLRQAAEELKQERRGRVALQRCVRELAQKLIALDEELELLQQHDVGMEEDESTE